MSSTDHVLGSIRRAGAFAETRMRFGRSLALAPVILPSALAVAAVILAAHKVAPARLSEGSAVRALVGVAALAVLAFVGAALRRLPPRAGTLALDGYHKLDGRLTNALEFAAVPAKERTPLMDAAIEDACAVVTSRPRDATLAAGRAVPLRVPSAVLFSAVPAALLVLVALLEIRTLRPEPPKPPAIDALALTDDDLDLFRDAAKDLERDNQSPEVKAAVDRFNRLVEDLAQKRLDRTDAFRQMDAIERDLLAGAEADKKRLEEELKETAKQLDKSDLTKEVAEALKQNDRKTAEQKLKELAKQLREGKKLDKAQLEKLRDALKKASERRKEALAAINEKRAELSEQLLKKKKQVQEAPEDKKREEERLFRKKERELERLDREAEQQQRANRELERLDRELSEAAQDLMRDLGITPEDLKKAAEDLEQAAEDLNRMEQESMSQQDKEELKKRLEELREILKQQGQGGKKRMSRMVKFGKRARGGSPGQEPGDEGDEGEEPGEGKPGKGKDGQGEGEEGEGQGQGKGRGKKGGKGQGDGELELELSLGPGGVPIPMPGAGSGQSGDGKQPGDGGGKGGKEWGTGSGGAGAGDRTDPKMGTQDVEAQGLEAGQGPTNSQVIMSAAEKGFRGSEYQKVFTQYRTVAEESIGKEQIPDGYRFYVQRYFQLIRPRD